MNPVVLIATHQRIEITTRNIESLLRQSVKPEILLICSTESECHHWFHQYEIHKQLTVLTCPNKPLGQKWQLGVSLMEENYSPNPLIITGSDDILGDGFIKNACRLVEEGNHFIGLRGWWQHKDGKGYYCKYLTKDNLPIGGGRIYSDEMLKAINYQVFDPTKDRHLDEYGWDNARKSGLKCLVLDHPEKEGLSIHAIKGEWQCLNPFTLKHKNIRLLRSESGHKVLPKYYGQNNGTNSNN
jgi:hypothetical protein